MTDASQSMAGKVCLVTGATSGVGKATARILAEMGATLVGVGRNAKKAAATARKISERTENPNVEFLLADLSLQDQVRALAAQFKAKHRQLHVLVNNAGALFARRRESADGIEMTFALNHLGYFLLTNLLLDVLVKSAPSRIVVVTSTFANRASLDFDDLQAAKGEYKGMSVYSRSALANLLFARELARRLEGTQVTVNAVSPGLARTRFALDNPGMIPWLRRLANVYRGIPAEKGAQTVVHAAAAPEFQGVCGKWYKNLAEIPLPEAAQDDEAAQRLWAISEEMTALAAP